MIDPHGGRTAERDHLALAFASVLVAASLFLPRPVDFAPLGAFGLFAGAYVPRRRSWIYPLASLGIYVLAIGGYAWLVMASVFLGFAGPALIGSLWLRRRVTVLRIGASALASSVWFFLVSNFGSWIVFGAPREESLFHHYLLGIPFFRNTVAGDLVFSALFFGGYALVGAWTRREAFDQTAVENASDTTLRNA